jgi:AP-1 complex subunit beta-1
MADFTFPWNKQEPAKKGGIYFTNKNSEIDELIRELESMKIHRQKEAMKEIIAGMTIGKDVCSLFPHVVNCMRTSDVELKKLIYLYIINFAKAKPSESILAVNSFLMDAQNKDSPMIRALSIRTMGCIRVEEIVTYLCETLKSGLSDEDSYVQKTSCICVAKLFCTCPQLVKDNGLIDRLIEMLNSGNSIVLSSAIVALSEISLLSGNNYLNIDSKLLKRILIALNEANEWGQIYILDALITCNNKKKAKYAEMIIDATVPLFSHINPAVIMSAVKVVLKYLDNVEDEQKVQNYSKKISMCLVSLMDSVPEMKYLLLRAMHCIIQKRHYLLDKDYKAFYVKAYEPIYVKFEKLDILYELTDNKNFEMILNEFKSYSMLEYDINLVKRAIKYIGNIGFRFEKSMNLCVDCISQILNYNQDFTIDQSVIVMRDLLRKYHGKDKPLELLIKINEDLIDKIRLPESKAAILYILGEYCSHIEKSTELIECFYNDFSDESEQVKLQILNACIKNFLTKPDDKKAEDLVTAVLQKGAEETVNADVRDRSYFYWRLLENDPDIAKEMILAEKPSFNHIEETPIDQELCDDILENITNVSCIYHKKYSEMILKEDLLYEKEGEDKEEEDEEEKEKEKEVVENKEEDNGNDNDNEEHKESSKKMKKKKKKKNKIIKDKVDKTQIDLLGLGDVFSMSNTTTDNKNETIGTNINSTTNNILDIF